MCTEKLNAEVMRKFNSFVMLIYRKKGLKSWTYNLGEKLVVFKSHTTNNARRNGRQKKSRKKANFMSEWFRCSSKQILEQLPQKLK